MYTPNVNQREVKSSKDILQDRINFFSPTASQSTFAIISILYRHSVDDSKRFRGKKIQNHRFVGLVNLGGDPVSFLSMAQTHTHTHTYIYICYTLLCIM